jgi:murein DD-endopeptidase MepM/ murein hydrolase activator NlpD
MSHIFILLCLLICFTGCSQKNAPIVDRSKIKYTKNNILNKNKYKNLENISSNSNEITVKPKETLYSIAKNHNLSLKDLIEYNKIAEPYHVKVGDKIIIPHNQTNTNIKKTNQNQIAETNNKEIKEKLNESSKNRLSLQVNIADQNKQTNTNITNKNLQAKLNISTTNQMNFPKLISTKDYGFIWPVDNGLIVSRFGPKNAGLYNDGINIETVEESQVKAVANGVVAYIGNELKGYGNLVVIKHQENWISAYAHLKNFSVKRGQKIMQGQQIGKVGKDSKTNKSQIYFGLRKNKNAVNPESYL